MSLTFRIASDESFQTKNTSKEELGTATSEGAKCLVIIHVVRFPQMTTDQELVNKYGDPTKICMV